MEKLIGLQSVVKLGSYQLTRYVAFILFLQSPTVYSQGFYFSCPQGQPEACIAEVNKYMTENTRLAEIYRKHIAEGESVIGQSITAVEKTRSNLTELKRLLAKDEGHLSEVLSSNESIKRLLTLQNNLYQLTSQSKKEVQSYLREIIVALDQDVTTNTLQAVKNLQVDYMNILPTLVDSQKRDLLNLVISSLDEIISMGRGASASRTTLYNQLNAAINSTGTDTQKRFNLLTRAAIEGALSDSDIASLNLSEKLSLILIQSKAFILELEQQKMTITTKLEFYQKSVSNYKRKINSTEASLIVLEKNQKYNEKYYRETAPQELARNEADYNTFQRYLSGDGCRYSHCKQIQKDYNEGGGSHRH